MANEQNLKNRYTSDQNRAEASKNGKKGGKASGAARRAKRELRERLKIALECPAAGDTAKKIAKSIGVEPNDATNYDVIVARLMLQAFKGDTRAVQMIFEYMGETPGEKRASADEKRKQKLFEIQLAAIDNLSKDNDAVLQYISAMKKNVNDDGTETKQETN